MNSSSFPSSITLDFFIATIFPYINIPFINSVLSSLTKNSIHIKIINGLFQVLSIKQFDGFLNNYFYNDPRKSASHIYAIPQKD